MTVTTGTGLDAQLGIAEESVYGTAVTPTRFLEFNSESLQLQPTWLEPTGLGAGRKHKRSSRVVQSRRAVSGDITLEHATKGMGLLWKHALASAAAPALVGGTTAAYEQIHTPGDFLGKSLTLQVGRPEPSSGVVRAHTFSGCKVAGWAFNLTDNAVPTLQLTVDGRDEDTTTALAAASYLTDSGVFDFSQATLKLGGTATTTAGRTTVAGGTAVATIVRSVSLNGSNPMDTERFGVGNAGLKAEPLENEIPTITGTLEAEFNKAELYDAFRNNDTLPMQLIFTGPEIEAGHNVLLEFTLPAVKLKTATPNVGGPGVVAMSTSIEAYDDEENPPIQVRIVSGENAL